MPAIAFQAHTDPETRPIGPFDMDEREVRASTRKLLEVEQREGVTLTVYGHDFRQWQTLKLLPDSYE